MEQSSAPLQLRPPEFLKISGAVLDVGDYAIPYVVDWNGDGRKDLIVGHRPNDKIALFLNQGSAETPALVYAGELQAAGFDIVIPGGSGCGAPAPWAGDFDADNDPDLIVGGGADGSFTLFRNVSTNSIPKLTSGVRLTLWNGDPITVGSRAAPCFADWDGDGLSDLLSGAGDGGAYFFKNIGSKASPAFVTGVQLIAGQAPLNLGSRSVVRVYDWDNDGRQDLLGSSSLGVYWCRNIGSRTEPRLAAPKELFAPTATGQMSPVYTSNRMRIALADWNSDAVVDLIIGNSDGTICALEGYRFAVTRFSRSPNGTVVLEWTSSPYVKYSIVTCPLVSSACNDTVATGISSEGISTSWTNRFIARQQFFRVRTP